MPDAADSLLRSASWEAEKLLRKRGQFPSVLFLTESADGTRQRLERFCNNAPGSVSDADLLTELARDVALDFAEADVVRFACVYLCKRVITLRPIDPNATMKPQTTRRQGVAIEVHSVDEPVGLFREILRSAGGTALLGAAKILEGVDSSPYAKVLQLAAEQRADAQAKAGAKVKAPVAAPVATKVTVTPKAPVAARGSSSSSWPPAFLLRQPAPPASASTE